jgi:hypothetical protein
MWHGAAHDGNGLDAFEKASLYEMPISGLPGTEVGEVRYVHGLYEGQRADRVPSACVELPVA